MSNAFESILSHFSGNNVSYVSDDQNEQVDAFFYLKGATRNVSVRYLSDSGLFQVKIGTGIPVPSGAKPAIAEAISKVNLKVKLGSFGLDWGDGELAYFVAQVHEDLDAEIPDELITRCVGVGLCTALDFFDAFNGIIYSNETSDDALSRIFGSPPDVEDEGEDDD